MRGDRSTAQGTGAAGDVLTAAALWAAGLVLAVPFVVWWARDFGRIPGRIWYWSGYDRRAWQWAVFLGFVAGGVIAIVTVVRWRRSTARTELLDDLRERVAAHDARVAEEARIAESARAAREARIVEEAEADGARPPRPSDYPNVSVLRPDSGPMRVVPTPGPGVTPSPAPPPEVLARRGRQ